MGVGSENLTKVSRFSTQVYSDMILKKLKLHNSGGCTKSNRVWYGIIIILHNLVFNKMWKIVDTVLVTGRSV